MGNKPVNFTLKPLDNKRLAAVCGNSNSNLKQVEQYFTVTIHNRANQFQVDGSQAVLAAQAIEQLYQQTQKLKSSKTLSANDVHLLLCEISQNASQSQKKQLSTERQQALSIQTPRIRIVPRNTSQADYLEKIQQYDINFAIGPAGTGKTFLAVAAAIQALNNGEIQRILLVRPAVEAGEALGFLPGDLTQKIDPYLRPLYDALYDIVGNHQVERLLEHKTIEIAPLAYMRGRTINEACVILDESQNSTKEQMKMCLTRIGYGSKIIITGDTTQIDLPRNLASGLVHANAALKNVDGIGFTHFLAQDVVRHPLVQHIVEAYDRYEQSNQ